MRKRGGIHSCGSLTTLFIFSQFTTGIYWKFNNALFDYEEYYYVNHIKENNPFIGEKYRELDDHRLKWELMQQNGNKGPYNCLLLNNSKRQRKWESDAQTRLEELDKRISDSTNVEFINKHTLKQQLLLFYEENARTA